MSFVDTIQPPPPPSPTESEPLRLGLWVQMAPDVARASALLELGPISTTVGRGTDVTHTVLDSWLSREHFRISLAEGGVPLQGPWLLEDLGTRNGTLLNGLRVDRAVVRLGDVIRAGGTVMVLDVGSEPSDEYGLVGASPAMGHVRTQIRHLGPSTRPVHITGESGVGKELAARAVHDLSARRSGPWVAVNCSVLSGEMVAAELFGAQRGAYTGATENRKGAFERADGGTLFLDEIGELPADAQAMLLRVLEVGEIQVLGGPVRRVDVRVVCATHRDLSHLVQQQKFRLDLMHRLDVAQVCLPPLRDRPDDLVALFAEFLDGAPLPPGAAPLLQAHPWPGNIRQLRNLARRLQLRSNFQRPRLDDLRALLREAETGHPQLQLLQGGRTERMAQRRQAVAYLLEHETQVSTAWRKSGLPRGTFFRYAKEVRLAAAA